MPTRRSDPLTSFQADDSIQLSLRMLQHKVLNYIRERMEFGSTDEELSIALDCPRQSTMRTRRSELVDLGLIVDSSRRRKTSTGRNAIVWIAEECK